MRYRQTMQHVWEEKCSVLVGKPEGKKQLRRSRRRRDDADWVNRAQDMDTWCVRV